MKLDKDNRLREFGVNEFINGLDNIIYDGRREIIGDVPISLMEECYNYNWVEFFNDVDPKYLVVEYFDELTDVVDEIYATEWDLKLNPFKNIDNFNYVVLSELIYGINDDIIECLVNDLKDLTSKDFEYHIVWEKQIPCDETFLEYVKKVEGLEYDENLADKFINTLVNELQNENNIEESDEYIIYI